LIHNIKDAQSEVTAADLAELVMLLYTVYNYDISYRSLNMQNHKQGADEVGI